MLNDARGFSRIVIACGRTDLRRGVDGLAAIIQEQFQMDPSEKNVLARPSTRGSPVSLASRAALENGEADVAADGLAGDFAADGDFAPQCRFPPGGVRSETRRLSPSQRNTNTWRVRASVTVATNPDGVSTTVAFRPGEPRERPP